MTTIRGHELPPYATVYLVERTDDGERLTAVAEATWDAMRSRARVIDLRSGETVDRLDLPDDGRKVLVLPLLVPEVRDCDVPDEADMSDEEADAYERGLDRIAARLGY